LNQRQDVVVGAVYKISEIELAVNLIQGGAKMRFFFSIARAVIADMFNC